MTCGDCGNKIRTAECRHCRTTINEVEVQTEDGVFVIVVIDNNLGSESDIINQALKNLNIPQPSEVRIISSKPL